MEGEMIKVYDITNDESGLYVRFRIPTGVVRILYLLPERTFIWYKINGKGKVSVYLKWNEREGWTGLLATKKNKQEGK